MKIFSLIDLSFLILVFICSQKFLFRKGKSTVDALTVFVESVVGTLEEQKYTLAVVHELSTLTAFITDGILLDALETSGVRGYLIVDYIYVTNRSQRVEIIDPNRNT